MTHRSLEKFLWCSSRNAARTTANHKRRYIKFVIINTSVQCTQQVINSFVFRCLTADSSCPVLYQRKQFNWTGVMLPVLSPPPVWDFVVDRIRMRETIPKTEHDSRTLSYFVWVIFYFLRKVKFFRNRSQNTYQRLTSWKKSFHANKHFFFNCLSKCCSPRFCSTWIIFNLIFCKVRK